MNRFDRVFEEAVYWEVGSAESEQKNKEMEVVRLMLYTPCRKMEAATKLTENWDISTLDRVEAQLWFLKTMEGNYEDPAVDDMNGRYELRDNTFHHYDQKSGIYYALLQATKKKRAKRAFF